jgi:hypothetical protein
MTAITTWLKGDGDALGCTTGGKTHVLKTEIDTSETNVADSGIVKLWEIPANTLVQEVIVNVTTAEGATLTLDVGDYLIADEAAVDADGFIDGANGNSAAATKSSDELAEDTTTLAYADGKYFADALNFIGILFNDAAETAVIEVIAICVDCR